MNRFFLLLLAILGLLFVCSCRDSIVENKVPNIILILTDDQGHGDLGFHGNSLIQTPHLDQLASESVRFTNFFVSPVCSPTRASIMTGRYSLRTGIYDTYMGGSTMAAEEQTIAEVLQANGFRTGLFGKWHLGDNYPYRPQDQGFEKVLTHIGGGLEQPGDFLENFLRKDSSYFDPYLIENGQKIQKQGYITDILTEAAIDFIQEEKDKPFFCYLAYNAPHGPLEVPASFLEIYNFTDYPSDTFSIQGNDQMDKMRKADLEKARRVYAMMSNVDQNIGKLRQALGDSGKADNTLIIFMSDNGPEGRRYVSGLYGRKGSIYEGGTRTPAFWYFPERLGKAREEGQLAAHIDIFPTLLELIGIPYNAKQLDGMSLLPYLKDSATKVTPRKLFFQWNRGFPEVYQNFAVRNDSFKLTGPYLSAKPLEELQLFDMTADPFEKENIADQFPDQVNNMKAAYESWMEDMRASPQFGQKRPVFLSNGPVRLNRNDWEGPETKFWAKMKGHGSWKIQVEEAKTYDIQVNFQASMPGHGQFRLRVGQQDRTITNKDTSLTSFLFENIDLLQGQHDLEAWYYEYWPKSEIYGAYEVLIEESK